MKIRIPSPLRTMTRGEPVIEDTAQNIGELIDRLETRYPGFKNRLCDSDGEVKRFINVFVNGQEIRALGGSQTGLRDSDEVVIIPAMAGGRK